MNIPETVAQELAAVGFILEALLLAQVPFGKHTARVRQGQRVFVIRGETPFALALAARVAASTGVQA